MSREIDKSDLSELDDGDLKYLHDRSEITTEQFAEALDMSTSELKTALAQLHQEGIPLEERANTGTANTANVSEKEYRRQLKERNNTSEDDEEDEEYEGLEPPYDREDVTNNDLRAELARRDLSVSGNKQEMIQRLVEDDESEDEEEDEEEDE